MKYPAALPVSALVAVVFLAPAVQAQLVLSAPSVPSMLIPVEGVAETADAVRLLVGLGEIRADLQLGLLALQDGASKSGAAHFTHAREAVLPGIADGLAAAGVPDLAPLLQKLEAAGGEAAVKDSYHAVEEAILRARAAVRPSSRQVLQSVEQMARSAAGRIDASGTTAVKDYQSAWSILMVARGELDLLARDQDRTIAKLAGEKAMAFDDLILFMPDPKQMAPVAFDPALILDLLTKLEVSASEA